MCHLSMKLSDTFDQNPPWIFDKIWEKPIEMKNALRGSLSNWCDADEDANTDNSKSVRQYVDQHPRGGGGGRGGRWT